MLTKYHTLAALQIFLNAQLAREAADGVRHELLVLVVLHAELDGYFGARRRHADAHAAEVERRDVDHALHDVLRDLMLQGQNRAAAALVDFIHLEIWLEVGELALLQKGSEHANVVRDAGELAFYLACR